MIRPRPRRPVPLSREQFDGLPDSKRISYLWDHCTFIEERIDYNRYVVKLYAVHDFYVEVVFDMKVGKVSQEQCHALTDDELHARLEQIDLRDYYRPLELDGEKKSDQSENS